MTMAASTAGGMWWTGRERGSVSARGRLFSPRWIARGRARGFDVELIRAVTDAVSIPVIASGGMGRLEHAPAAILDGQADAIAMAHVLHYAHLTIDAIRARCLAEGIAVRRVAAGSEPEREPSGA